MPQASGFFDPDPLGATGNERRYPNTRFLPNPCKFRLRAAFELLDKVKYDKQILLVVIPKTCNAVPF